ncbi:MAG: hypothetical protein ACP5PZ_07575, partial [Bacteroidales bacterium]
MYGYDLAPYFDINNLTFSGISKSDYLRPHKLPEGLYRFNVEVLDYYRGIVVSNTALFQAFIVLNDPPVINYPANGSKISYSRNPQIVFNWTPRHLGSPNSAFSTIYRFRMVEVIPPQRNPYEAMLVMPTLFETTTPLTTFVYDISYPPLVPGRVYAFNVTAEDVQGRDLFKNGGTSETYTFTYGDECSKPEFITASPKPAGMELRWNSHAMHDEYEVWYMIEGHPVEYTARCTRPFLRVSDLPQRRRIIYRVKAFCGAFESDFTDTASVVTDSIRRRTIVCGTPKPRPSITNFNDILDLNPGDTITAGGYTVILKDVGRNEDGSFTGECVVIMPFFNYARVRHRFDRIRVNELRQLFEGKLIGVSDLDESTVARINTKKSDTPAAGKIRVNTSIGYLYADSLIVVSTGIDTVYYASDSTLVVVKDDGTTEQFIVDKGDKIVIKDSEGHEYLADGGRVTTLSLGGGDSQVAVPTVSSISQAVAQLPILHFKPDGLMRYGLDSLRYEAMRSAYPQVNIRGQTVNVPYKAIEAGSVDYLQAMPLVNQQIGQVAFSWKQRGSTVMSSRMGNAYRLTLGGLVDGQEDDLQATVQLKDTAGRDSSIVIGQCRVVGYSAKSIPLYLIPVGESAWYDQQAIATGINDIYRQAAISWQVQWLPAFSTREWDVEGSGTFVNSDANTRMDYTSSMRALVRAYKKANRVEKDAVYVFLVNLPCSDASLKGFMPFSKQFGFVFVPATGTDATTLARTISHEVAHGTFNLRHTFSPENPYPLPQGTTDNLMDYATPTATTLHKYQWDLIHHPQRVWFAWLEEEEEGELSSEFKGTPVVFLGDTAIRKERLLLYNDTSKTIKIKFETSDTSKTKVAYQLIITTELNNTKLAYPQTGCDTLVFN